MAEQRCVVDGWFLTVGVLTRVELLVVPAYRIRREIVALTEAQLLADVDHTTEGRGGGSGGDASGSTTGTTLFRILREYEHQWLHWVIDPTHTAADQGGDAAFLRPPSVIAVCQRRVPGSAPGRAYDGQGLSLIHI